MIEPTDEMLVAYAVAYDQAFPDRMYDGRRAGLAAVLAIVERDYDVRCGVRCPPERGYGALRCTRPATAHPEHVWTDGDAMVVWS